MYSQNAMVRLDRSSVEIQTEYCQPVTCRQKPDPSAVWPQSSRGSWAERGINAIFLEAYWNSGSPVDQYRWYDDFVVSTEPIGPVIAGDVPEVIGYLAANSEAWQIEVGEDGGPATWRSQEMGSAHPRVFLDSASLSSGMAYFCRARQKVAGEWSEWSPWHQPFRTGSTDTSGGTE